MESTGTIIGFKVEIYGVIADNKSSTLVISMTRAALFALLFFLQPILILADEIEHVGNYRNVSSKDGGEHCAGYSLGLWKYREQIFGLLDVHAGLCGDPPCGVIKDARLNSKTGRLEFWSSISGERIQFEGTVTRNTVDGVFNRERSRLIRDPDSMSASFEPNRNILAWCKFWSSIPRCSGVQEFCQSQNVHIEH